MECLQGFESLRPSSTSTSKLWEWNEEEEIQSSELLLSLDNKYTINTVSEKMFVAVWSESAWLCL